jgi:hypothetical protein
LQEKNIQEEHGITKEKDDKELQENCTTSKEEKEKQLEEKWIKEEQDKRNNLLEQLIEKKRIEIVFREINREYETELMKEMQKKELICNKHERILWGRDDTPLELSKIELGLKVIESNDPLVRKETISKELDFIRKKWSELPEEMYQRKIEVERKFYERDKKFDNFSEDERYLILATTLGDFKLKLQKND